MKKIDFLVFSLVALCLALTYSYTLDTKLATNGDNATYITLARNMAAGHGYALAAPDGYKPVNHFPPGYSTILSVFEKMGIDSLVFFKVLNVVFMFLAICLLYMVFAGCSRQRWLSAVVAVMLCFSMYLLHFAGMAMSEMSYMFFIALGVFCIWKYSEKDVRFYRSPWFWIALVSAVAAYHIRSVGIALVLSIVVFLLFRKEWLASAVSAGTMVLLMVPWVLRNAAAGLHSRYMDTVMTVNPWRPEEGQIASVGEFVSKMVENLDQTVIKGFPTVIFNYSAPSGPSGFWAVALGIAILAVVCYGAWNTGKLRFLMLPLLLGNIGLFAIWHGGNDVRYVTPFIPFVVFFFYNGIFSIFRLFLRKYLGDDSWWGLVFLLAVSPMIAPLAGMHRASAQDYAPKYKRYFELARLSEERLPAGSVICCRKPDLFGYHAPNMYTVNYLFDRSAEKVLRQMVRDKVDYVVVDQLGFSSQELYLVNAIKAHPDLFYHSLKLDDPETLLFRFDRQKAESRLR